MSIPRIKVWDPLVRAFHWSLVVAFFVAYFTEPEDSGLAVHVWAGYLVGGLIVLRVIWGFIGSPHAHFSDFAFGPFQALRYLGDLARGRSRRHLGHSPAGAWMVYVLLVTLSATVVTGMIFLAQDKQAGPLASLFAPAATAVAPDRAASSAAKERSSADGEHGASNDKTIEEMHELLANLVLILVVLHLLGVVAASVAHRENLVRSMVTGYKRSDG